ncbi:MAG: transporter substrate-binding domain-containing protein [Lachnospiraceae bacterium]|nr:transporter substrate-binding domain-containing protein [Lachnospiraceae bacterium]
MKKRIKLYGILLLLSFLFFAANVNAKEGDEETIVIKLGYYEHYMPFCGKETEVDSAGFLGKIIDCMREDLKEYGVEIECIAFSSKEWLRQALAVGEIQMMFPAYENNLTAEENGYILSNSLLDANVLVIFHDTYPESRDKTIAVASKDPIQELYIADNYPEAKLLYYDTPLECLEAVKSGAAGCTIMNEQIAEGLLESSGGLQELKFYSALTDAGICFAIRKNEVNLLSVINHEIHLLPDDLYESAISEYYLEQSRTGYVEYAKQTSFYLLLTIPIFLLIIRALSERWKKQQHEENKKRLLAEISHDMRTPCTVVNGYLKAMQSGLIPEEENDQYMKIIQIKMEEILELLDTFHEYSLIEHPDLPLTPKRVDICDVIQRYLAARYEELELADFELEADIPEERIFCKIDEKIFDRVLNNIINNSLKYNPPGTLIFLSVRRCADKAQILVGDNGVGISKEIKEKLFTPLYARTGPRHKNSGSGLGITIVQKIVEAHGGTISLVDENETENGTRYCIELPVSEDIGE